jgi:hypothetical protein
LRPPAAPLAPAAGLGIRFSTWRGAPGRRCFGARRRISPNGRDKTAEGIGMAATPASARRGGARARRRGGAAAAWLICVAVAACADGPPPAGPAMLGRPVVAAGEPPPCAMEYTALLDLATLARSYGPNAGLFMDALGELVDQLDQCMGARGRGDGWRAPDGAAGATRIALPR